MTAEGELVLGALIAAGALLIAGVSTWVVAVRSEAGLIGRNRWVGVRNRRTLGSDEAWMAAQRAAAPYERAIAVMSVVGAVIAIGLIGRPRASLVVSLVTGGVIMLLGLATLVVGTRAADRPPQG